MMIRRRPTYLGNCYETIRAIPFRRLTISNDFPNICQEELLSYFEGRNEIPRPTRDIRTWVILLFSVLLIILGVVRLIGNIVDVGLSNVYNIPIVEKADFR